MRCFSFFVSVFAGKGKKKIVLFILASFLRITANYYRAQDRCDFSLSFQKH